MIWELVSLQGTLRASSKLHDDLFHRILRCPMKLFDTTPMGRILNRFSKDMDEGKTPGDNSIFLIVLDTLMKSFSVFPPSGHPTALPGWDVHPERDPGFLLPSRHQQCFPVVSSCRGSSGLALHGSPLRLQGFYPGAKAPGQQDDVTLHVPHHLQHSGSDNAAGLRPGPGLPQKVEMGTTKFAMSILIMTWTQCGCFQVPCSVGPEPGAILPVQLCNALARGAPRPHQRRSHQHHCPHDGSDAWTDLTGLRRTCNFLRRSGKLINIKVGKSTFLHFS